MFSAVLVSYTTFVGVSRFCTCTRKTGCHISSTLRNNRASCMLWHCLCACWPPFCLVPLPALPFYSSLPWQDEMTHGHPSEHGGWYLALGIQASAWARSHSLFWRQDMPNISAVRRHHLSVWASRGVSDLPQSEKRRWTKRHLRHAAWFLQRRTLSGTWQTRSRLASGWLSSAVGGRDSAFSKYLHSLYGCAGAAAACRRELGIRRDAASSAPGVLCSIRRSRLYASFYLMLFHWHGRQRGCLFCLICNTNAAWLMLAAHYYAHKMCLLLLCCTPLSFPSSSAAMPAALLPITCRAA